MINNYFVDCESLEEVKKIYLKKAKLHHPDMGGNTEDMKELNNLYEKYVHLFKTGKTQAHQESNCQDAMDIMEMVDKLIHYQNIKIEVCGIYIWISGDTKPIKDLIKSLNFKWASGKKEWYWKPVWYFSKNRSEWSKDQIRNTYGSKTVNNKNTKSKEREKVEA